MRDAMLQIASKTKVGSMKKAKIVRIILTHKDNKKVHKTQKKFKTKK
jgi:hypothetical protein